PIRRRLTPAQSAAVVSRRLSADMAESLNKVPEVQIDPEGKFKYILVRVKVKDGTEHKDIVRGTKSAEYHSKCVCGFAVT
ncbi:14 kDa phosphohistidine phosphatase-like, partial [Clarias magur]